jgi:hypothetical protein
MDNLSPEMGGGQSQPNLVATTDTDLQPLGHRNLSNHEYYTRTPSGRMVAEIRACRLAATQEIPDEVDVKTDYNPGSVPRVNTD